MICWAATRAFSVTVQLLLGYVAQHNGDRSEPTPVALHLQVQHRSELLFIKESGVKEMSPNRFTQE